MPRSSDLSFIFHPLIVGMTLFALTASLHPRGLSPSVSQLRISQELTVSAVFSIAAFLVLALAFIAKWRRLAPIRLGDAVEAPRLWGLWALVALLVLSIASSVRVLSVSSAQNSLALGLFVVAIIFASSSNIDYFLQKLVFLVGPVMATISIVEAQTGVNLVHNQQLAQILPLSILVFAYRFQNSLALDGSRWLRFALGIGLIVLLTGVLSTGQRMASAISVILVSIIFARRGPSTLKSVMSYLLGSGGILMFSIGYFLIQPSLRVRLHEPSDDISIQGLGMTTIPNTNGRLTVWQRLLSEDFSWTALIFGHGTGSAVEAAADIENPHSEYVRLFYDLGIIGLSLWIGFLVWLLFSGFRLIRNTEVHGWLVLGAGLIVAAFSLTHSIVLYTDFGLISGVILGGAIRGSHQRFSRDKPPPA